MNRLEIAWNYVTYIETCFCRQHYSMNNCSILLLFSDWACILHDGTADSQYPDNPDRLPSIHVHRTGLQEGTTQKQHRTTGQPTGRFKGGNFGWL